MNASPSVLVLDDDLVVLKLLSMRLKKRFPHLTVECQQEPVASGAYDIYVLDNDFHGRPLVVDLAEHIKRQQPESLVIALSGTFDTVMLRRLINCGCAGAFDKGAPEEIDALIRMIAQHLDGYNFSTSKSSGPPARFTDTVFAITELIRGWNRRLELEERRELRKQGIGIPVQTLD